MVTELIFCNDLKADGKFFLGCYQGNQGDAKFRAGQQKYVQPQLWSHSLTWTITREFALCISGRLLGMKINTTFTAQMCIKYSTQRNRWQNHSSMISSAHFSRKGQSVAWNPDVNHITGQLYWWGSGIVHGMRCTEILEMKEKCGKRRRKGSPPQGSWEPGARQVIYGPAGLL